MDAIHLANNIAPPSYQGGRVYSAIIQSSAKTYGSNNQATFFFNADAILPQRWSEYGVKLTFMGDEAANYTVQNWQVLLNAGTRTFSFNASSQSQSNFIGFVKNDGNSMSCSISDNPGISMCRPSSGNIPIEIRGIDGSLVTTTSGSDVNAWMAVLTFEPITSSLVVNQKFQDI
jgi:hypothetical protein